MNHPNRVNKYKDNKGSSCAMCKPFKHGWAKSNDDVMVAEIKSHEDDEGRYPSKSKPMPRNAWKVESHGPKLWPCDIVHKFKTERDARKCFQNKVDKIKSQGKVSYIQSLELKNPKGDVVDRHES